MVETPTNEARPVPLAGHGMVRDYFDDTTAFYGREGFIAALIEAYDEAAERARRSAHAAVSPGGVKEMEIARWDEAVAQTIEQVLCMFPAVSDEGNHEGDKKMSLPSPPRAP